MTAVYRFARVRGNVLSGPFSGGMGDWWLSARSEATCVIAKHKAPDPDCQCGIWASPDPVALSQFLRDWRMFDDLRVGQVTEAFRGATRQQIRQAASDMEATKWRLNHLGEMRADAIISWAREFKAENVAIVRAVTDEAGTSMYIREPGMWPGNHEYLAQVRGIFGGDLEHARQWSARLNHPDGFFRYGSATITHIWLDARWSDYIQEMANRYSCKVRTVAARHRQEWTADFEMSAYLPGVTQPNLDVLRVATNQRLRGARGRR